MFGDFLYLLRRSGLKISLTEWMALMEALDKGLEGASLTGFYYLCRALLVKTEADFDRFDRAFLEYFKDVPFEQEVSQELLDWLDHKTDFFTAPASTRFHGACEGGLCMHSLNVYHALHDTFFTEGDSEETFAICALLHDLCKANYYKPGTRNVKNEATGQWEKVPSYSVEDLFPYGHGEKSVFLIERFMKLRVEEAVAIRWHMGGFDDAARGGCFAISEAYDKYPLAVKLHIADLEATYLMEHRTSAVR